ncbi:glycoside hydrolase family 125 protein [Odoribacter lunatus]|uniref:glycoside hydrolase family 125 protein n=1 Tax=Odoribacter lunatus TaxID=2941335 RepID=UPI002041F8BB|nr:glycoside hydrolase family 125 protein [Odoribacter lunatus]
MVSRRDFLKKGGLAMMAAAVGTTPLKAVAQAINGEKEFVSNRPLPANRRFMSKAVEEVIESVKKQLTDPKLAWMFENCFPNTLDTTVDFQMKDGRPDTFVITGDINAMWLRDSGAQVWPYLPLCKKDEQLRLLIAGVINRQTKCILLDRYANAFTHGAESSEWKSDLTEMKPYIHERKWEVDSLCYPVRLAYNYWKTTGDTSVFDKEWQRAAQLIYQTFTEQQRKKDKGPYRFQRRTERKSDTLTCDGWGQPVKPVGLIVSCFRPSDDSTDLGFLIPSNLFAVKSLRQLAEIWDKVIGEKESAARCRELADEVEQAVRKYAVARHPQHGKVYAFEADGFGNTLFMDDANVPSLLALPYLECVSENDEVYKNTRRMVWSDSNPYFFKGSAGEGIGGPHIGYDMVWPMSLIMKAITSKDDAEIRNCVRMLRDTDGNTGFMHESFHKDNASKYTRRWFAWANTLFGELILKLVNEGKVGLLNSL